MGRHTGLIEFALEYQKGVDNGAADALSGVPICHNHETVHHYRCCRPELSNKGHSCVCRQLPAYIEEVRKCFKEAYTEVHLQTNSEVDQQKQYYDKATSTVQLIPGDIVLMKLDAFQGKRKVKDKWSEAEYVVIRQVTNDVAMYEVRGGNVKVAHHNRLFLVDPTKEDAMPLGASKSVSDEGATPSTLAELTPLK